MSESRIVWSDESGDLRKKSKLTEDCIVNEAALELSIRRITSGKGRTIIEIGRLPMNKKWCQKLCQELKKALGVGGAFKENYVEIHGEKLIEVVAYLEKKQIRCKKTGG